MKLRSVSIEGFGPYKDAQRIEWPTTGVVAIHGENGRGKTSLFNAMRYAFTGHVKGRTNNLVDLHKLVNSHNKEEGKFGFTVSIDLEDDGNRYEITRGIRPAHGVTRPDSEDDYDEELFVRRNGMQLSADQAHDAVSSLLPETIARFFFFDGELLAEYERLVDPDEGDGLRIKQSIEGILGLPVLENLRSHLKILADKAAAEYTKLAAKDQNTQKVANGLAGSQEAVRKLQQAIDKREARLQELQALAAEVEERIRKFGSRGEMVGQKREKQARLEQAKAQRERVRQTCNGVLKDAWRLKLWNVADRRARELRADVGDQKVAGDAQRIAKELCSGGNLVGKDCPVCSMTINTASERHIRALSEHDSAALAGKLHELRIMELLAVGQPRVGTQIVEDFQEATLTVATLQGQIKDLENDLADFSEETFDSTQKQYRTLLSERDGVEKALEADRRALKTEKEQEAMFMKAIRNMASGQGNALRDAEEKMTLHQRLLQTFQALIDAYRERLRAEVEKTASEFFTQISNEPDFKALRINKNYGLEIVHRNGTVVDVRSAGFEQVVAVSLIAALHANAPFRGPVVMDTFLGRLDKIHSSRLLERLPKLTEQATILVHSSETQTEDLHKNVGNALKKELTIDRVRHGECAIVARAA